MLDRCSSPDEAMVIRQHGMAGITDMPRRKNGDSLTACVDDTKNRNRISNVDRTGLALSFHIPC